MTENRAFYMALFAGILVFGLIHFVSFKGSLPYFVQITGGGALFDTAIPRSVPEIYDRLEGFGEAGRREYVFRNLTTDILLPFSLLPLLLLGIRRLNRRFDLRHAGRILLLLPFVYVALDLVENFVVILLISGLPEQQPSLAAALPIVTLVKRVAVMISVLSLLGGLGIGSSNAIPALGG